MKLLRLFPLAFAAIAIAQPQPQTQPATASTSAAAAAATPDSAATLRYIHAAWATLTRSMTDCHSFGDTKISTQPVLYMPAEVPAPPEVIALEQKCHVRVLSLPRRLEKIGELDPRQLSAQGLLFLPRPYVVPGGRFNEMYGWDSYFIVLGLEADHHAARAKDMVDNFYFEIEHYGGVLNANRTYYLTRSQPPFLTSMIRAVYENPRSFPSTPEGREDARAWLEKGYELAQRDYSTWTRPEHRAGVTGLARFYDYGSGPVPEMADDATYYIDVLHWLVDHPRSGGASYLIKGPEHPSAAQAESLRETSCDVNISVVCMRAWYRGYRLTRDFYKGDRAMRESGFDPSFRWGPFDGATHHYAPVDLNCLLYRYERDLEHFALLLGKPSDAKKWERRAQRRDNAIQRYLWQPKNGVFGDYDFVRHKPSTYAYITSLYPLWAGVATRSEARRMVEKLNLFERPGGLSMSNFHSGMQWDEPFGWAPTNWIGVSGLDDAGFRADAKRLARKWNTTVDTGFAHDGTIREKYNVVAGNANVHVSAGYTTNEIGFGWTNAVYLKMRQILKEPSQLSAP